MKSCIFGPLTVAVWAAYLLIGEASPAAAQESGKPPEHVRLTATLYRDPFSKENEVGGPKDFVRGEHLYLRVEGVPEKGWHTYPLLKANLAPKQEEYYLAKARVINTGAFIQVGEPTEQPVPELHDYKDSSIGILREHHQPFVWTWELLLRPTAPTGSVPLEFEIELEACDKSCIWETHLLKVPLTVSEATPLPISPELQALIDKLPPESAGKSALPANTFDVKSLLVKKVPGSTSSGPGDSGLLATLLKALAGGLVSLVTPCVFPMIPITVSFFLKQGEKKEYNALTLASIYCLTIVAVLTAGGIALVSVLQVISQHYLTNLFLTGVFIFFGLSLLGMYEIMLPTGLADLTSKGQGKGGLVGVVFMALTFSIISFACVGPIYGGFITLQAADGSAAGWLPRVLGPLAFALAFASPFFVLALFPTLLHALPKSGSWMNSVKVVMGFLELAAAFKFVRAAELNLTNHTEIFTYDLCVGIYIALAAACALYLLGVFRLPHDHGAPESIGVLRLVWALAFLAFGLYLLPALFKEDNGRSQTPQGKLYAWVSAFLLPEETPGGVWSGRLDLGLAQAEKEHKLVFLDFTGVSCNNCRLNENNIFPRPQVQAEFKKFIVVRLYTDVIPEGYDQVPNAKAAAEFRNESFGNFALPYYVVLQPKGKTLRLLGAYEKGLIDSPEEFAEFLRQARARAN